VGINCRRNYSIFDSFWDKKIPGFWEADRPKSGKASENAICPGCQQKKPGFSFSVVSETRFLGTGKNQKKAICPGYREKTGFLGEAGF
jgi:hypothetical protein